MRTSIGSIDGSTVARSRSAVRKTSSSVVRPESKQPGHRGEADAHVAKRSGRGRISYQRRI